MDFFQDNIEDFKMFLSFLFDKLNADWTLVIDIL